LIAQKRSDGHALPGHLSLDKGIGDAGMIVIGVMDLISVQEKKKSFIRVSPQPIHGFQAQFLGFVFRMKDISFPLIFVKALGKSEFFADIPSPGDASRIKSLHPQDVRDRYQRGTHFLMVQIDLMAAAV